MKTFESALQQNEPTEVFFRLLAIYQSTKKFDVGNIFEPRSQASTPAFLACSTMQKKSCGLEPGNEPRIFYGCEYTSMSVPP